MTFQTLYGGELFCMPEAFGDRHALRAWGTCNTDTEQYSIGQPKTVPQVATQRRVRADPDRERARSCPGSWGKAGTAGHLRFEAACSARCSRLLHDQ